MQTSWAETQGELEKFLVDCNLYHICDSIVKPMTARFRCSWVNLIMDKVEDQIPTFFVSHWWGGGFEETLSMLRFHAWKRKQESKKEVYWICTFANNQHDLTLSKSLNDTPFSRVMERCRGTVALVDNKVEIFKRVWCIFELGKSVEIQQQRQEEGGQRFVYDLASWLPLGSATWNWSTQLVEESAVLDLEGIGSCSQKPGGRAADGVAVGGARIDVVRAEASRPQDKSQILAHIAKVGEDDAPTSHPNFDQLNKRLRKRFAGQAMKALICPEMDDEALAELRALLEQYPEAKDAQDATGQGPLHRASRCACEPAVKLLLQARANVNIPDKDGWSPMRLASPPDAGAGHQRVQRLLQEAGAKRLMRIS